MPFRKDYPLTVGRISRIDIQNASKIGLKKAEEYRLATDAMTLM